MTFLLIKNVSISFRCQRVVSIIVSLCHRNNHNKQQQQQEQQLAAAEPGRHQHHQLPLFPLDVESIPQVYNCVLVLILNEKFFEKMKKKKNTPPEHSHQKKKNQKTLRDKKQFQF